MSRFVTRERVEELGGFGQGEREDQPVWLGGRKRFLGLGSGGVSIPQGEVREAGAHMRFDERERGAEARRVGQNLSERIQRDGGIPLGHADRRTRVANGAKGTESLGCRGESAECCPRLVWHP